MAQDKELTWQYIKDLANSLDEEQLKKPVKWWGDETGGSISDANILDEDYVSDGEAYGPRSEMDEANIDPDEPVFHKGTPMLWML